MLPVNFVEISWEYKRAASGFPFSMLAAPPRDGVLQGSAHCKLLKLEATALDRIINSFYLRRCSSLRRRAAQQHVLSRDGFPK